MLLRLVFLACLFLLVTPASAAVDQCPSVSNPNNIVNCGGSTSTVDSNCFRRCCRSTGECLSASCITSFGALVEARTSCTGKCLKKVACLPVTSSCTGSSCLGFISCVTGTDCAGHTNGDGCIYSGAPTTNNFKICDASANATYTAAATAPVISSQVSKTCPAQSVTLSQAHRDNLQFSVGAAYYVGYTLSVNTTSTIQFTGGSFQVPVFCDQASATADSAASGDKTTSTRLFTISLPSTTYKSMLVGLWYPTADHQSGAGYMGSSTFPDLCSGGSMYISNKVAFIGSFKSFSTNPTPVKISVKFHYGDSSGTPVTTTNLYPSNCCRYRFTSPTFPAFVLPAVQPNSPGDITLSGSNTIVDINGKTVTCNGDTATVWSTATQSWLSTYNDAGTTKSYGRFVYINNLRQLWVPTLQTSQANMRTLLMTGSLVSMKMNCQDAVGTTAEQCLQFWIGPNTEQYEPDVLTRAACTTMGSTKKATTPTNGRQTHEFYAEQVTSQTPTKSNRHSFVTMANLDGRLSQSSSTLASSSSYTSLHSRHHRVRRLDDETLDDESVNAGGATDSDTSASPIERQWTATPATLTLSCYSICQGGTDYIAPTPTMYYNYTCCDITKIPTQASVTAPSSATAASKAVTMTDTTNQGYFDNCYRSTYASCIYYCGLSVSTCILRTFNTCFSTPCPSSTTLSTACTTNLNSITTFYTTNAAQLKIYQTAQNAACMCITAPVSNTTTAPSPLESWPFYAIDPADLANPFAKVDLNDLIPTKVSYISLLRGSESVFTPKLTSRQDIVALSSALEVIGVDYYLDGDASFIHGGLIIAKGSSVIEHSIPTCARFAGGKVRAVTRSQYTTPIGVQQLLVGIVQQAQAGGLIMTTTLVIQVFTDHLRVTSSWSATQMKLNASSIGVITLQVWSTIHPTYSDPATFAQLISGVFQRFNNSVVPVIFDTAVAPESVPTEADPSSSTGVASARRLLEETESDSTNTSVVSTSPMPAVFWVESISYVFPHLVELIVKSPVDALSELSLAVLGWSEPNAHRNTSTTLPLKVDRFESTSDVVLGQTIHSARVALQMTQIIDTVIVLSPAPSNITATADPNNVFVDQVFTNLGYFFYIGSSTGSLEMGTLGAGTDVLPQLPAATRETQIILPGSGWLSGVRRNESDVFGLARALTPDNAPIDLSAWWGISIMVRLNRVKANANGDASVYIQLRIETANILDSNYPITSALELVLPSTTNANDVTTDTPCWTHLQYAWSDFQSTAHPNGLDLTQVRTLSLVVTGGAEEFQISFGGWTVQSSMVPLAVRQLTAPCSTQITQKTTTDGTGAATRTEAYTMAFIMPILLIAIIMARIA